MRKAMITARIVAIILLKKVILIEVNKSLK
jgi:hypothetical protein